MKNKGDVIEITAYKSPRKVGETVEIRQMDTPGIVNLGTVLKVIKAGGVVMSLQVKILA